MKSYDRDTSRTILKAVHHIINNPQVKHREIVKATGIPARDLTWFLRQMAEEGLLEYRIYPTGWASPLSLVPSIGGLTVDQVGHQFSENQTRWALDQYRHLLKCAADPDQAVPWITKHAADTGKTISHAANTYAGDVLGMLPGELLPGWLKQARDGLASETP